MADWTLLKGDCLEVMRGMEAESVDAIVTDPPYGLGKTYAGKKEDASSPYQYWSWLQPRYTEAWRVLRPGGLMAVWQTQLHFRYFWDWFGTDIHIYAAAKNFVQLRKTPINYGYDPVIMKYKPGSEPLRPEKPKRSIDFFVANTAAIVSNPNRIEKRHPFPRPLDQTIQIVTNFVIPGGIILDPFAGSGTTGVAAIEEGFGVIMIEREEVYCDIIRQRMAATQEAIALKDAV